MLASHEALKAQNDNILVRVGMEQQYALQPILKGRQAEEDQGRAGLGNGAGDGDQGDTRDTVGQVGESRR